MKKLMMKASLLALAMGVSSLAAAEDFNYSYLEAGVGQLDHGDAVFANGSFNIAPNWTLVGGLEAGNYDLPYNNDADTWMLEGGAQYNQKLQSNLSLHAGLKLLYVKWDANFNCNGFGYGCQDSGDDLGLIGNVGVRFQVAPKIQLEGDVKVSSNDAIPDDGIGLQGDVRFQVAPNFSIAPGFAIDTELDGAFVGFRFDM